MTAVAVAPVPGQSTAAMALRMETVNTLSEELFVLQTMADDRAVKATYVAGDASLPDRPN